MAGPQGGDVEGMTRIDVTQGEAIEVASASFDPGYIDGIPFGDPRNGVKKANLVQGYFSYGRMIGEG